MWAATGRTQRGKTSRWWNTIHPSFFNSTATTFVDVGPVDRLQLSGMEPWNGWKYPWKSKDTHYTTGWNSLYTPSHKMTFILGNADKHNDTMRPFTVRFWFRLATGPVCWLICWLSLQNETQFSLVRVPFSPWVLQYRPLMSAGEVKRSLRFTALTALI